MCRSDDVTYCDVYTSCIPDPIYGPAHGAFERNQINAQRA